MGGVVHDPLQAHAHVTGRVQGSTALTLVNDGLIHPTMIEQMQGALDYESRPHVS